ARGNRNAGHGLAGLVLAALGAGADSVDGRVQADAEVDLAVGYLVPARIGHDVAAPDGVPASRIVRVRAPAAVDAERVGVGERAARQVRAGRRRRAVVVAAEVQARGAGEVVAVVGPVEELAEHL